MNVHIGQRYMHYKGKMYTILAIGKDSDTLEDVVIYQGEYEDPEFGLHPVWVRSLTEFVEILTVDGKIFPRFILV